MPLSNVSFVSIIWCCGAVVPYTIQFAYSSHIFTPYRNASISYLFHIHWYLFQQGLPTDCWRITMVNQDYQLCDTYPAVVSLVLDCPLISFIIMSFCAQWCIFSHAGTIQEENHLIDEHYFWIFTKEGVTFYCSVFLWYLFMIF